MIDRAEVAPTVGVGPAISRGKRSECRNRVPRGTIGMNEVSGPIQALAQGAADAR